MHKSFDLASNARMINLMADSLDLDLAQELATHHTDLRELAGAFLRCSGCTAYGACVAETADQGIGAVPEACRNFAFFAVLLKQKELRDAKAH